MTQLSALRFLFAPLALLLTAAGAHAQDTQDSLADIAELAEAEPAAEPAAAAASSKPAPAAHGGGESLQSAREHFERGVDLYADGDYRAALVELTRAYGLSPTYKMLYNLGQVTFELRDYAGAERYYRAYLSEGADEIPAERREQVRQELARLQSRVASLRLRINLPGASVRVDDVLVSHPEAPVRVSAGQRKLLAEKSGYAPVQRVLEVAGGEELEVRLDFGVPLTAAASTPERSGGSAAPLILTLSAGVLTAAGLGLGYWAYVDTNARNDRLNEFTTRAELDRLSSQAHSKALLADVLFGTAAAAAAVGLVMYLAQPSAEGPPAARATRRPVRASY